MKYFFWIAGCWLLPLGLQAQLGGPMFTVFPTSATQSCDTANYPAWLAAQRALVDAKADSCGLLSITDDAPPTYEVDCGELVVAWIATDSCGEQVGISASFTVVDDQPPVFSNLEDSLFTDCPQVPPVPDVSISDNCDDNPMLSFSTNSMMDSCQGEQNILREWIAMDDCGNSDTLRQWVFVRDTVAPQIVGRPEDITVNCHRVPEPPEIGVDIFTQDSCPNLSSLLFQEISSQSGNPDSCIFYEYTLTRVWTAQDACGNTRRDTQFIEVFDTLAPTLLLPPDITVSCEEVGSLSNTGLAQAVDSCGSPAKINFVDQILAGNCPQTYTLERGWYAEDVCGNISDTLVQTIHVIDTMAPVFLQPPQSVTLSCLSADGADTVFQNWLAAFGNSQVSDNCGLVTRFAAVPGSYDPSDPTTLPGVFPGMLDSALCPSPNPGIYRQEGVDFIAIDECGNLRIETAIFRLLDNAPPVLVSCPPDTLVPTEDTSCQAVFPTLLPVATEECSQLRYAYRLDGGDTILLDSAQPDTLFLPLGEYQIEWLVTDCAGNTVTCFQQIEVQDQTPPQLSCPPDSMVDIPFGVDCTAGVLFDLPFPLLKENCSLDRVEYRTQGDLQTPISVLQPGTQILLPPGTTEVTYIAIDDAGLTDTCRFELMLSDNTPPEAICQPIITVQVNPSGFDPLVLDPLLLDNGSVDNCAIVQYETNLDTLLCQQAGTTLPVQLAVFDAQGNSDSCSSLVKVETLPPQPDYVSGLCGGDSLLLFANPPGSSIGSTGFYDFEWAGPASFSSNQPNPIRPIALPSFSGTYVVTITGITGCSSSGTVEVAISDQPMTPLLQATASIVCLGGSIDLETQQFGGGQTSYFWYLQSGGMDSLIATTSVPLLTLPDFPAGTYAFRVVIEVNGCPSNPSLLETVEVVAPVTATTTNEAVIERCAGESFALGTSLAGPDISYSWTGPNFSSSVQNPPLFENIQPLQSGLYELIVFRKGCPSLPVFTEVIVNPLPPQPELASNGPVCEGEELVLFTDVPNGETYTWQLPDLSEQITNVPVLTIDNSLPGQSGNWRVEVSQNGCTSETSLPLAVLVEAIPSLQATNNGPICEGDPVQLAASNYAGASYFWTGPALFTSAQQNPVTLAKSGYYTVELETAVGCQTKDSTLVEVVIPPAINGATKNPTGCVDGQEDVILTATLFPPDDGTYAYQWSGPGFSSTQPQAVIPDATAVNNGSYTVQVQDSFGCRSNLFTVTVDLKDIPATPAITGSTDIERCEGEMVTLSCTPYNGTIQYIWQTPTGEIATSLPSLTLGPLQPMDAGGYSVLVLRNGCLSDTSGQIQLTVFPIPDAPMVTASQQEVCLGDTLLLQTPFVPNTMYEWIGPGTFDKSVHNPVIFPVTTVDEGTYAVRIIQNGCASDFSPFLSINVLSNPALPVALNDGPICLNLENEVTLLVSPGSATPGATYTWFDANTGQQVGGPTPATGFVLTDLQALGGGTFPFQVQAVSVKGCRSGLSNPTLLRLDTIPDISSFAGADQQLCEQEVTSLQAVAPSQGSGQWSQLLGPPLSLNDISSPQAVVQGLETGPLYLLSWNLNNGACKSYDSDTVALRVYAENQTAEAGPPQVLCNVDTVQLNAQPALFDGKGQWTQPPGQIAAGVSIEDPEAFDSRVTDLQAGNTYTFTWEVSNPGCGVFTIDGVSVTIGDPSEEAVAGSDRQICAADEVLLNANAPQSSTGTWSTNRPEVRFQDINAPLTNASDLQPGENLFFWTLSTDGCPAFDRDTVAVFYFPAPEAIDDLINADFAEPVDVDVLSNDFIGDSGVVLTLLEPPDQGQFADFGDGQFRWVPPSNFSGTVTFTYELCSRICSDACSLAEVVITIAEGKDCAPPTIITPNNDGVNDAFVIPCFSAGQFEQSELLIFNQWGDELFRASPYQNDWQGTYNGSPLPVGTYFYRINYGDGRPVATGFLVIER